MSVDALIWFSKIKQTDPQLFGGIVGCCIGFVATLIVFCAVEAIALHTKKKEQQMAKAFDLLGQEVIYNIGSSNVSGVVVSVDYDLTESGLETTVYIDVDCFNNYLEVDYEKNGKRIRLKGEDNEQRAD
jgi:hypothetical protein